MTVPGVTADAVEAIARVLYANQDTGPWPHRLQRPIKSFKAQADAVLAAVYPVIAGALIEQIHAAVKAKLGVTSRALPIIRSFAATPTSNAASTDAVMPSTEEQDR